jgi:hypothetical protein
LFKEHQALGIRIGGKEKKKSTALVEYNYLLERKKKRAGIKATFSL